MPLRIPQVCLFQKERLFRSRGKSSTCSIACMHAHELARTLVLSFVFCASQMSVFERTNEIHEYTQNAQKTCTHTHTITTSTLFGQCVLLTFFLLLIRHCYPKTLLRPHVAQPAKGAKAGSYLPDHDCILPFQHCCGLP
jgi:hypothetical protein